MKKQTRLALNYVLSLPPPPSNLKSINERVCVLDIAKLVWRNLGVRRKLLARPPKTSE
jgi:hypothetical protein